eukprot:10876497-Lingulodinium_polyedra.AAC.1
MSFGQGGLQMREEPVPSDGVPVVVHPWLDARNLGRDGPQEAKQRGGGSTPGIPGGQSLRVSSPGSAEGWHRPLRVLDDLGQSLGRHVVLKSIVNADNGGLGVTGVVDPLERRSLADKGHP